jgi:hypothetical protein
MSSFILCVLQQILSHEPGYVALRAGHQRPKEDVVASFLLVIELKGSLEYSQNSASVMHSASRCYIRAMQMLIHCLHPICD